MFNLSRPTSTRNLCALAMGLVSIAAIATLSTPARSASSAAAPRATMAADLAKRDPDVHWPAGFDPRTADLFAHNDLFIHASCERVWEHLVDAVRWPQWYPNARDVEFVGAGTKLEQGAVFRWKTFGLPIESTVHEHVPASRLGWHGAAQGMSPAFFHTFLLRQEDGGCRVVTEEVGKGPDAAHLREVDEGLLHRGHDLWLATLKWVAESAQPLQSK